MFPNFSVSTSYGLPVPYTASISPAVGTQIHVSGTATGNRFEINLKNHQDDFVLHFNPRFGDNTLVLNTAQRGAWGQEERRNLPFQRGVRFQLVIMITDHGFNLSVNNAHVGEFRQRLPLYSANLLEIKGDINLESAQVFPGGMGSAMGGIPSMGMGMHYGHTPNVSFTQTPNLSFGAGGVNVNFGYPSAPTIPSVVPSPYPMGGGSAIPSIQSCDIHNGSRIFVRGHIHHHAKRFEINFLQGYNDSDDIAFHFNPRFDARTIVKNHRRNGQWGSEENQPFPPYMPLMAGAHIDLQITCQSDRYTVFMNNQLISEFAHKIPPGFVRAIQYKGDITLTSVGQM